MIDIGANLANPAFSGDREAVVARAVEAGVTRMVVTGTDEELSATAADIARAHPSTLCATAGVHPHDAKKCGASTIDRLRELAAQAEVVAIGECGLDFNRDYSPRPVQEEWFVASGNTACGTNIPILKPPRMSP